MLKYVVLFCIGMYFLFRTMFLCGMKYLYLISGIVIKHVKVVCTVLHLSVAISFTIY